MEAVSVLTTAQSHRGADARHMIQWKKDALAVKGEFQGEEDLLTMELRQKAARPRQTLVNGHLQKRLKDWLGRVPLVSFSPDDLALVKGEPSVRRRTLNTILCQVDAPYFEALQRYTKVTAERNAALRQLQEGRGDTGALDAWTSSLLKDGIFITLARRDFLSAFNDRLRAQQKRLSSGREEIDILYKPSLLLPDDNVENIFTANKNRLAQLRAAEIAMGATLIGPHRDDLEFSLNGSAARDYASQGQQRTIALALKLAEHEFLTMKLGRKPICLLDDVLSELDPARRTNLVEWFMDGSQCLVSLTALSDCPEASPALAQGQVFHVAAGVLTPGKYRSAASEPA